MLTYTCSICKASFDNGEDSAWLHHLIQEGHQNLARKELARWEESVVRNQVLVIFGTLPVGRDVRILEKLSQGGWSMVTDFVWFEGRPQVGFVRFGCRDKLLKAMGSIQEHKFLIDACQAVHVMEGEKVKWWSLLSECGALLELEAPSGPNIWIPAPTPAVADPSPLLPGPSAPKQMKLTGSSSSSLPPNDDDSWASVEWSSYNSGDSGVIPTPPTVAPSPSNKKGLWHHLSSIRKLIEIPDEEYRTAVDITYRLREAFIQERGDNIHEPLLKPTISRHWILKLKYAEGADRDNVDCALVIHKEPLSKSFKLDKVKRSVMAVLGKGRKTHFPQYDIVESGARVLNLGMSGGGAFLIIRYGFEPLRDTSAPLLMMNLVLKARYPVETQVWHLVKQLLTFNPHCYSVLAVAYYWAKVNDIRLGKGYRRGSCEDMGDPSGMNWLLIYFLQADGLIPITREVMEHPHQEVLHDGKDIGFSEDTTWWKPTTPSGNPEDEGGYEKFAEEVFTLLYRFFLFCDSEFGGGSNPDKGWILNSRDGTRISIAEMMVTSGDSVTHSKLLDCECVMVQEGLSKNSWKEPFVILHPFMINWRINANNAWPGFKKMKMTGMKLKDYFLSGGGSVKREKLELEEFLKLLKL